MAIVRWDPWRDLAAFERQLDQMMGRTAGSSAGREQRAWAPALDVHQEGDTMVICAEVAGMDPDQVEIQVEDDVLTLSGSREDHGEVEDGQWIRRERHWGQFRRSVSLPPGVDPEQIQASARNGLIEIRVPRPTPAGAHRVSLRGEASNGGNSANGAQPIDVSSGGISTANAKATEEGVEAAGIVPGTEEQAATTRTAPGETAGSTASTDQTGGNP